jgi:NIMA (never in mitosis gene a)-related kinase 1/4/5
MVNYRIGKCIGSGSYGKVFLVKDYSSNSYAMKRISTYSISNKEKMQIINELRILKYSKCPYLLQFFECKSNLSNIEIVTNYARLGDFLSIISRKKRKFPIKHFEELLVWSYFIQVCYGVDYLHNNNIIHRDIKCGNIFLDRGERVYIGDLGSTKVLLGNCKLTSSSIGTPYYMCPEVINKEKYDKSVDIWGLGCFLFEMITYYPPFTGRNFQHLKTKIKSKKFSVNIMNYKQYYTKELLLLPERILRFYNSIAVSNILKLKEIETNKYLIPYITETTIDIQHFNHKFQDISIASWYTICNNINRS